MTENELNEAAQPPAWLNCVIVWGVCVLLVSSIGWTLGWLIASALRGIF
jgi:predicted membrane protein